MTVAQYQDEAGEVGIGKSCSLIVTLKDTQFYLQESGEVEGILTRERHNFLTLQYCIGFAIYQNESATGIHVFSILNPPPSSPCANGWDRKRISAEIIVKRLARKGGGWSKWGKRDVESWS